MGNDGNDMPAALSETHVSIVFFVGDRAYKLKKPVSMGFLDFSTREAREAVCRREVELNRRLAPDVYLGVADVVGPDGEPWDHLVVMRRMPPERRLSTLVGESAPEIETQLRRVARAIAAFHATADTSDEIAQAGLPSSVASLWESSFREMKPFGGRVLDSSDLARAERLAGDYLAGRAPLLLLRVTSGFVRDGHGDLLADDIFCLDDGPRILDCIEFDDHLRHGDVVADTAFLAMDLERLGRADLGETFLQWYAEFSAETHPESLAHHWVAYRALVRSKVACLRHEQGDEPAAGEARHLLAISLRHLQAGRVRMVLVGGLPGTGKSTLAASLAGRLGWAVLRSDEVRKELAGLTPTTPAPAEFGEGLYTDEMTDRTYRELLRRAGQALEMGESVVLDASWTASGQRARAADVAEGTSSELIELRCSAPPEVAAARLDERARARSDVSDATPAIASAMAAREEPWPDATIVDTSGAAEAALAAALQAVEAG